MTIQIVKPFVQLIYCVRTIFNSPVPHVGAATFKHPFQDIFEHNEMNLLRSRVDLRCKSLIEIDGKKSSSNYSFCLSMADTNYKTLFWFIRKQISINPLNSLIYGYTIRTANTDELFLFPILWLLDNKAFVHSSWNGRIYGRIKFTSWPGKKTRMEKF